MQKKKFYRVKQINYLEVFNPQTGAYQEVTGAQGAYCLKADEYLLIGESARNFQAFMINQEKAGLWQAPSGYRGYCGENGFLLFRNGYTWYIQLYQHCEIIKLGRFALDLDWSSKSYEIEGSAKLLVSISTKKGINFWVVDQESGQLETHRKVSKLFLGETTPFYITGGKGYLYTGAQHPELCLGRYYDKAGGFFEERCDSGKVKIRFCQDAQSFHVYDRYFVWGEENLVYFTGQREDGFYDFFEEGIKISGESNIFPCSRNSDSKLFGSYEWNSGVQAFEKVAAISVQGSLRSALVIVDPIVESFDRLSDNATKYAPSANEKSAGQKIPEAEEQHPCEQSPAQNGTRKLVMRGWVYPILVWLNNFWK